MIRQRFGGDAGASSRTTPNAGLSYAGVLIVLASIASPAQADLVLRLDASDTSTLTVDGSNLVQAWDQKFGQTSIMGPLTAIPGETPPTFNPTGLNGLGTLEFDGQTDTTLGTVLAANYGNFINAGPANGNQYSIFFVAEQAAGVRGTTFAHGVGFGGSGGFAFRNDANNFSYRRGSFTAFTETDTIFKVRSVVSPDGAGLLMGVNGLETPLAITDHVPLASTARFIVGGRDRDAGRDPTTGAIAEIAIFNTALDEDTRTGIYQVLGDKWGLPTPGASAAQIALGMDALNQEYIEPILPVPIVQYGFATDLDLSSTDLTPYFAGSHIASGGADVGSSSLGQPSRSLFLGRDLGGGILIPTWDETSEVGPQTSSTDYLEFTLTPTDVVPLNIAEFFFDLHRRDSNSLDSYALYADEDPGPGGDNFATKIAGATTSVISSGNFETIFADLEGVEFLQGVHAPTTFRLYLWHDGAFSTGPGLTRVDNISLTSFIPEPSAIGLALLGLLGIITVPRRR